MSDTILMYLTKVLVPLAWPMVAILGVWAFKSEIREVFKRVVKAGPSGLELTPQTNNQPGGALRGDIDEIKDESEGGIKTDGWGDLEPWLNHLEQNLARSNKSNDLDEIKRIAAANDRRAGAQLLLRTIYGTQYRALLRMLEKPQSLSDLDELYKEHLREIGEKAYPTPEG